MRNPEQIEKLLDHAWNYFELHAKQRMTVFNFFLVLAGLISAGLAATVQGAPRFAILGLVLGLMLTLASFVFWKLDQRVSFLLKHAEEALAALESDLPYQQARLFLTEPVRTSEALSNGNWWTRMWTYGKAFRISFWTIGIFGLAGAIGSLLRFAGDVRW